MAAPETRIDEHAGAWLEAVDAVADFVDDTGDVGAADVGELELQAGQTAARPEIQVVHRGGVDGHPDVPGGYFGHRHVGDLDDFGSTMLAEDGCFHRTGKFASYYGVRQAGGSTADS